MNKTKMSVEDFIVKYREVKDDEQAKSRLIKSIIEDYYVSVAVKNFMSKQMIEQFSMRDDNYYSDAVKTYLIYTMTIMDLYTILDVNAENWTEQYDLLKRHGLIEAIANEIGDDIMEFQAIFNMCKDDFNKNHLTIHAFVQRQVNKVLGVLTPALNKVATNLDHIDLSKLEEIMENIKGGK